MEADRQPASGCTPWPHGPAHAPRPRRRGDLMSNCVGSSGLGLPASAVAQHGVERGDHLAHDGDKDDLGLLAGGGEAVVECFEGGGVTAGAGGCHVGGVLPAWGRRRCFGGPPACHCGNRAMLKKLIRTAAPVLIFSEHIDAADGERMFRHACALGLEGVVSKRLDKPYSSGRCHHWRKVKNPTYDTSTRAKSTV